MNCQPRPITIHSPGSPRHGLVIDLHCRNCGRAIEEGPTGFWRHVRRCTRCGLKPAAQPMATCLDCYREVRA